MILPIPTPLRRGFLLWLRVVRDGIVENHSLQLARHLPIFISKFLKRFPLGRGRGELADDDAIFGIDEKLVDALLDVLHRAFLVHNVEFIWVDDPSLRQPARS